MGLKSSEKRVRQAEKRRLRNRMWKSKVKTAIKKFRTALASKASKEEVERLLREAVSLIDKAKAKGVFHPNKASREKSRIQREFNLHFASQS
ncbi:MAG TPA: 30S ribosomal protein S20 [bacterium]|nr:30S ribosomal protein S20 [bacterium]HEX67532.1 30S ribosomal protein S20 [bacterium]